MKAIERLKRDHAILRSKFDVLEAGLRMGPGTWYVLREVCFTLARQLRNHMQREEDLVMACREGMTTPPAGGGVQPHLLADLAVEHHDEPEHLRTINQLFVEERGHNLERIQPALTGVINGLRHHMAEEEQELFPILERALSSRTPEKASPQPAAGERLYGCMTVSGVLRAYPETRPVFEELFVNVFHEGSDCLDEVAWRRGIEIQDLLDRLARSAHLPPAPAHDVSRQREVCGCR